MKKHTPTPWAVGFGNGLSGDVISWQAYLDESEARQIPIRHGDEAVCVINYGDPDGRSEANARHIVRCVNNHDALCELLRACAMQLSIEDGATRRIDGILANRAFDLLEGME